MFVTPTLRSSACIFALVASAWQPLAAQVVVSSDACPSPGDTFTARLNAAESVVSVPLSYVELSGEQHWNFDELLALTTREWEFEVRAGTDSPGASAFPTAETATGATESGLSQGWDFHSRSEQGRLLHGTYIDGELPLLQTNRDVLQTPPFLEVALPLAPGASWEATSSFPIDFGGLRYVNELSMQFEVDAWGTILLPQLGTHPCVRLHEARMLTIDALGFAAATDSYSWHVPALGEVARISSPIPTGLGPPPVVEGFAAALLQIQIANSRAEQPVQTLWRRGDVNVDGQRDLSDSVFVLNNLFLGGNSPPCSKAADTNADGSIDLSDGVFLLNALFLGGAPLTEPVESCGDDASELPCESFEACEGP